MHRAVTYADCAGIFGAAASSEIMNVLRPDELRRQYLRPAVEAVAMLMVRAEAYGDAVLDLHLADWRNLYLKDEAGHYETHRLPEDVHCGRAILTIP
jgi:hypothetical protein